jgi:hypothetical protein
MVDENSTSANIPKQTTKQKKTFLADPYQI